MKKKEILEIQYSRVLVRNQNISRARDWAELCTQLSLYIETDSVSVMTSQNLSRLDITLGLDFAKNLLEHPIDFNSYSLLRIQRMESWYHHQLFSTRSYLTFASAIL